MLQKRKAQNRAAQRAFRDRKEKHLKDLETKVAELTKSSEDDKHENGLLKAQVERLHNELQDYRKRLSATTSQNRSPPTYAARGAHIESAHNNFAFDFPSFGGLTGSPLPLSESRSDSNSSNQNSSSTAAQARAILSRENSAGRQISPGSRAVSSKSSTSSHAGNNSNGNDVKTPDNLPAKQPMVASRFGGLFDPTLFASADYGSVTKDNGTYQTLDKSTNQTPPITSDNGTDSHAGLARVFRFNSGSISSNNDSPSQPSLSPFNGNSNGNSSCNTSPGPSHPSPPKDPASNHAYQSLAFGDKSNTNGSSPFLVLCVNLRT